MSHGLHVARGCTHSVDLAVLQIAVTGWSVMQIPGLGVGRICMDKAVDEAASPLASGYMGG